MKSPQDKICDALTLVGLLCVIIFGSWSLLPDADNEPVLQQVVETPPDEPLPADTLEEVYVPYEAPQAAEETPDSLATDTLGTDVLLETDSATVEHAHAHEATEPVHHESISEQHANEQHAGASEEKPAHKKAEEEQKTPVHTESLME